MKTKRLNVLLMVSFLFTILVPVTGIVAHKLASTLFLILCVVHTVIHRKRLDRKKYGILGIVILSFASGLFGMIYDEIPQILALHKILSIGLVFFLAIHIFIFSKKTGIRLSR